MIVVASSPSKFSVDYISHAVFTALLCDGSALYPHFATRFNPLVSRVIIIFYFYRSVTKSNHTDTSDTDSDKKKQAVFAVLKESNKMRKVKNEEKRKRGRVAQIILFKITVKSPSQLNKSRKLYHKCKSTDFE